MQYGELATLWILWCTVHSGMIAPSVTDLLRRTFGANYRFYRLAYNVVALVTFSLLLYFEKTLPATTIFRWQGPLLAGKYLLLGSSLALFYAGARHYDLRQLLGLRQISTGKDHSVLSESGHLQRDGILQVTRHPWYLAAVLLIWAGDISTGNLIVKLILTIYVFMGTLLEERKLVREFGDEYRLYQKQVSMLIPFKYLKNRLIWKREKRATAPRGQH